MRIEMVHDDADAVEAGLRKTFVRGLEGDGHAYEEFLRQITGRLRAYLRRRLFGWPDDVEDLVQECLLAMHNQRQTYLRDQPVMAWACAIARYKLIDLLRSKSSREALHEPLDDFQEFLAASSDDAAEARRDLLTLLDQLPDRHRLPIVHVKLEGLSVNEAAARTGMSASAVKVGVHRGLKALAAKLRGKEPQ